MRLARRVVGTQLGMFADDACLARHVLVALDLALPTRIAGLYGSRASAHVRGAVALPWWNAPGPVAQFGNAERPFFQHALLTLPNPHHLLFCMASLLCGAPASAAYLVLARFPLPSQDLIDVGSWRRVLHKSIGRVGVVLVLELVHGRSSGESRQRSCLGRIVALVECRLRSAFPLAGAPLWARMPISPPTSPS
jgi:hypothetical protein